MTWSQTLLIAVVPVALTSAALLAQQILNNRRDAERDARARAEQARERDQEAHASVLQALYGLWRPVEDWYRLTVGSGHDSEVLSLTSVPDLAFDRSEIDEAMSRLSVLVKPEISDLATEAYWEVLQAAKLRSGTGDASAEVTLGQLRHQRERTRAARKKYAESARRSTALVP